MRKIMMILLAVTLLLSVSGCGNTGKETAGFDEARANDDQYYLGTSMTRMIAEGPDAYYLFAGDYLYYMEKDTLEAYPLCGKPDCLHDRESDYEKQILCSARIWAPNSITYCDGGLYITHKKASELGGFELLLTKYDLSGNMEKELGVLPLASGSIIHHRGKLYFSYIEIPPDAAEDDWGTDYYACLDLKTGEQQIIEEKPAGPVGGLCDTFAYGDYVYFRWGEYVGGDIIVRASIGIYNTTDGTLTYMEPSKENASLAQPMIFQDKLIFSETLILDRHVYDDEYGRDIYMAELDGTGIHKVSKAEYSGGVVCAYENMFLVSNRFYPVNGRFQEDFVAYKDFEYLGHFDLSGVDLTDGMAGNRYEIASYSDLGEYILFMTYLLDYIAVSKADIEAGDVHPWIVAERSGL